KASTRRTSIQRSRTRTARSPSTRWTARQTSRSAPGYSSSSATNRSRSSTSTIAVKGRKDAAVPVVGDHQVGVGQNEFVRNKSRDGRILWGTEPLGLHCASRGHQHSSVQAAGGVESRPENGLGSFGRSWY